MKTPRGALGAALLLWGFATGQWALGIGLAALLEGLQASTTKHDIAATTLSRWLGISALTVLGAFVYVVVTQRMPEGLYAWLRWLPVLMSPWVALQILCGGMLPREPVMNALLVPMRRASQMDPVDTTYGYLLACLMGAATAETAGVWFYAASCGVMLWLLMARAPAGSRSVAVLMIAAAAGIGFAVNTGLTQLQSEIEDWSTEFLQDLIAGQPDPFRERTRIGDMGKVKLSDRIVMRVVPAGTPPDRILLRENAFDTYAGGEWQTRQRVLSPLTSTSGRWSVSNGPGSQHIVIRRAFPQGKGLVALPAGTRGITNLPAAALEISPTGAVRAVDVPRFVAHGIDFDATPDAGTPTEHDLLVPAQFTQMLDQVLDGERLRRSAADLTLRNIEGFFATRFAYSLALSGNQTGGRTLSDFLLRDRTGHCEYFATATVLLLRRAGIPARYSVGYAAQEYSKLEQAFLVRNQHAHAWVSAHVGGRWIDVDTTPAIWAEAEAAQSRNLLTPVLDLLSWLLDLSRRDWFGGTEEGVSGWQVPAVLGLGLVALLLWWRRHRRPSKVPLPTLPQDPVSRYWREIERTLTRRGSPRRQGETAMAWAARLTQEGSVDGPGRAGLTEVILAYYQARYDPVGSAVERARFVLAAKTWLRQRRGAGSQ